MNRRQFTQRLAALFATPALPSPAIPAAAAPAGAPAVAVPSGAYYWAKYLNSLHNTCTPDQLKSLLNVSDRAARSMHGELVAQGVIDDLGAVAQSLKPNSVRPRARWTPDKERRMLTTRIATPEDIPALADIWHQGWHEAHAAHVPRELCDQRDRDSFGRRLHRHLAGTIVLEDADTPAGFCMVKEEEIYQFYLQRNARGCGQADVLMAAAEARLRAQGVVQAHLYVIPENARAIAFYNRHGWTGDETELVRLETLDEPFELPCLILRKSILGDGGQAAPEGAQKRPPECGGLRLDRSDG